jgi:hypothetical protein
MKTELLTFACEKGVRGPFPSKRFFRGSDTRRVVVPRRSSSARSCAQVGGGARGLVSRPPFGKRNFSFSGAGAAGDAILAEHFHLGVGFSGWVFSAVISGLGRWGSVIRGRCAADVLLMGFYIVFALWLAAGVGAPPWKAGFWIIFAPMFLALELAAWRMSLIRADVERDPLEG